jgi:hypothetical protein
MSDPHRNTPFLIVERQMQRPSHSVITTLGNSNRHHSKEYKLSFLVDDTEELQLHISQRNDEFNLFTNKEYQHLYQNPFSSPYTHRTIWSDTTIKTSHVTETQKLVKVDTSKSTSDHKQHISTIPNQDKK